MKMNTYIDTICNAMLLTHVTFWYRKFINITYLSQPTKTKKKSFNTIKINLIFKAEPRLNIKEPGLVMSL